MLYYSEGFCGGYRQSMPVVYEKRNDGKFYKVKMHCENREGHNCDECQCFSNAPETVREYLLRETPY